MLPRTALTASKCFPDEIDETEEADETDETETRQRQDRDQRETRQRSHRDQTEAGQRPDSGGVAVVPAAPDPFGGSGHSGS